MLNYLKKDLPDYISIFIRKVKQARIEVEFDGDVRFVVPPTYSRVEVLAMYASKKHWIDDKRAKIQLRQKTFITLEDDEILLFGKGFRVHIDSNESCRARVDHQTRSIYFAKNLLDDSQKQVWYRLFAKQYLLSRIVALAKKHCFQFNRLSIREQKTRWGSCSSRGNISLNWKLLKAPIAVSDYVIIHELVHTEIMNHKPIFWQRVSALDPTYEASKSWLKTYGHEL